MLLAAAALVQAWFFVHCVHPYVTLLCALVYALWYFDGKEYTGERRWEAFRRLRVWRWLSPVEYHAAPGLRETTASKRLFVVVPCVTPAALMWTFGFHGGELEFRHVTHYVVPPPFMWVPLVRDVLMWSGAITYSLRDGSAHSLHAVLLDMLGQGRAVAYTPAQFLHNAHADLEQSIDARYPTADLLDVARQEQFQIVPVTVQNERVRYAVWRAPASVQRWTHARSNYPFPLVYGLRVCGAQAPPPLTVQFGPVMNASIYQDTPALMRVLRQHVDSAAIPELGDKDMKDL